MERELHVCYVSQEYPPETGWGGLGTYTYEMARGLVEMGHRVTVISRAVERESCSEVDGVQVYRVVSSPDWNQVRGMWRLNGYWPGFAWAAMRRLRALQAETPIDVIEAGENRADGFFIALLRRRPPLVVRLHTAWIFVDRLNGVEPDRKQRLTYRQERESIQRAEVVTAPSRAVVELTGTWIDLTRRPVVVIPNPIDVVRFTPAPEGMRSREVLFVGRLERNKGLEGLSRVVPEVLRRVPGATFRFVGSDGHDRSGRSWRETVLHEVPPGERERIIFEQTSREALPDRYRRAAVCVVPSLWENFPYVALEAMACGVPVVGGAVGGLPEVVGEEGAELLVAPDDGAALRDTLCTLLLDQRRRAELGRRARKRVEEEFSTERIVPRMVEVYWSAPGRR